MLAFTATYQDRSMNSKSNTPIPTSIVTPLPQDNGTLPHLEQSTNNTMLAYETVIPGVTTTNVHSRPRATRQRINKAPQPLAVPDINDDAVERKRVLNVLAQRRYRERKRQHRKGGPSSTTTVPFQDGLPTSTSVSIQSSNNASSPDQEGAMDSGLKNVQNDTEFDIVSGVSTTMASAQANILDSFLGCHSTTTPSTMSQSSSSPSSAVWIPDLLPTGDKDFSETCLVGQPLIGMVPGSPSSFKTMSISSLSSSEEAAMIACETIDPIDLLTFSSVTPTNGNGTSSQGSSVTSPGSNLSAADSIDFPDSYILPMPELILLRACTRIAERMQCLERIWSPEANSPFNDNTITPSASNMLPSTWQPTASQSTVPHHPIVDFIPWPNVRDRLIMVMALPEKARPKTVGAGNAAFNLAYDLEDPAEGMRIWGDDVYDPTAWEVGEVFFKNWWFVLDRQVIAQSNYWRRLRGAPELKMPSRVEELAE